MAAIGANIFTQEWEAVYLPQKKGSARGGLIKRQRSPLEDLGFSIFYNRTVFLQTLCIIVFIAIPIILGMVTYLNLNPSLLQNIERAILGL